MLRGELRAMLLLVVGVHTAPALYANETAEARPILLIHIPKTGGTSVINTLGLHPDIPQIPECAGVPVQFTLHERHATALVAKDNYTDAEWQHALKLAIVRDPWARLVSLYVFQQGE